MIWIILLSVICVVILDQGIETKHIVPKDTGIPTRIRLGIVVVENVDKNKNDNFVNNILNRIQRSIDEKWGG